MFIDRTALKARAKTEIGSSNPSAVSVGAAFIALSIVIAMLSSKLLGGSFTQAELQRYINYVLEENYQAAVELISRHQPSMGAYLIDAALQLMLAVVSAGYVIFLLNTLRKSEPCFANLLDGFALIWRITVLYVLRLLIISLWSLLFIVPGIIAAYGYRQALYLLIDHPEMSPVQCLRESRMMMRGHKSELFMLDLSFIGWYFLSSLPVLGYGVQVWTTPYIGMTRVLYYQSLHSAQSAQQ